MTSTSELKVNRRNTSAFVAERPVTITLTPQRRVRTATGGFEIAPDPDRAPQTFRVIDLTTGYATQRMPPQRTLDGIERSAEFMLLGEWGTLLERFDTWEDGDGSRWEITSVYPDNDYERRAVVVRHGD